MQLPDDALFFNMNFVCRDGGYFSAPVNSAWQWHGDAFAQNKFYFVTEGGCHIWAQGQYYAAQPGDWFLIPAITNHGYSTDEKLPLKKYWMHFDLYPGDVLSKIPQLPVMVHIPASMRGKVENLFRKFTDSFRTANLIQKLEAKAAGIQLFAIYLNLAFPDGLPILQEAPDNVMSLLSYMQQNLELPLTNADLAQMLHLHPTYFCQWFRKRLGISPQQYLLQSRLEAGKCLLEKTDKSISSIAREVGFCDASHFSHAFRNCYGMSPSRYRTLSQQKSDLQRAMD